MCAPLDVLIHVHIKMVKEQINNEQKDFFFFCYGISSEHQKKVSSTLLIYHKKHDNDESVRSHLSCDLGGGF